MALNYTNGEKIMGLQDIASRIDETLDRAGEVAQRREAVFVENDANKMAHHIVAYALERAEAGHSPYDLGSSMVQGACIGEDETGGFLADPVVSFLEEVLAGARSALQERKGADEIVLDPVAHVVQYFLMHNTWPESATPSQIARAKTALAAGQRGSGKGASYGTYI